MRTRIQYASQTHAVAWPPKHEAGENHNNCPRASQFDQQGTFVASQQLAVEVKDSRKGARPIIDAVKNLRRRRMHINPILFGALSHYHLSGCTASARHCN